MTRAVLNPPFPLQYCELDQLCSPECVLQTAEVKPRDSSVTKRALPGTVCVRHRPGQGLPKPFTSPFHKGTESCSKNTHTPVLTQHHFTEEINITDL